MSLTPEERMWIQNLQVQLDAHTNDIAQIRATLNHIREQAIYNAGRAAQGGPIEPLQGDYITPRFGSPPDQEGTHDQPRDITIEGAPGEFGVKE